MTKYKSVILNIEEYFKDFLIYHSLPFDFVLGVCGGG